MVAVFLHKTKAEEHLQEQRLKGHRLIYLFSCPELLRFEDGRRQQFNSALFVSQSSIHQLSVLDPSEETASYGHPRTRHHVVLDQTC